MQHTALHTFIERFNEHFANSSMVKLTLSKPRQKGSDLKNMIVTPVKLKNGIMVNIVFRHTTRDITKNYTPEEASAALTEALQISFLSADMYTPGENLRLLINNKGEAKLLVKSLETPLQVTFSHNRTRGRIVDTKENIWLRELKVTNDQWEVRHEMKDKYVQINRYIELLEPEISKLDIPGEVSVADMGSGKGYLTFALYDFLQGKLLKDVKMKGVEYRNELVDICNGIAQRAGFNKLSFEQGSIEETDVSGTDILIALHACDTATDEAIYKGISSGVSLIVCAPCCQKQIRNNMHVTNELTAVLKHGILMERQAELITDGLRALILEAFGYKTKVFEFISSEHTPKNVMIVGRKIADVKKPGNEILNKIAAIKTLYGIKQHHLEYLLGI